MTSSHQTAALTMDVIPLLMRRMRKKFREKRVRELSMAQFRTLAFLDANQGASLSEAASYIGLGLPSMSKLVDALVNRKLIRREVYGKDRRRVCLSLTRQGKRTLDEAHQHTQTYFSEKFSELSAEERRRVSEALILLRKLFAFSDGMTKSERPEM